VFLYRRDKCAYFVAAPLVDVHVRDRWRRG
jgi:hypothetical protein